VSECCSCSFFQKLTCAVSGNKLTTVPPSLFQLPKLEGFNLSSNQLTELPDAIDLPVLKKLWCESCL
jgi:Leucine-rich repeat (LRR) protein